MLAHDFAVAEGVVRVIAWGGGGMVYDVFLDWFIGFYWFDSILTTEYGIMIICSIQTEC